MRLKIKNKRIKPRHKAADCYIKACKDNNQLFARFTRMATDHAPIGSYYKRFSHLQKSDRCLSPGWHPESRDHMLDKCSRYSRHWEAWLPMASREPSSLLTLVGFLIDNPRVGLSTVRRVDGFTVAVYGVCHRTVEGQSIFEPYTATA